MSLKDGGSECDTASAIAHYRTGIVSLLKKSVLMTCELERYLDISEDEHEVPELDSDGDPWDSYRISCALLLRKARVHAVAVLRANEASNIHSLAVQMRPVLECAGQVVFIFDSLIVAPKLGTNPKRAQSAISDYLNAEHYRIVSSATKGEPGHDELLRTIWKAEDEAAASVGAKPRPDAEKRKGRRLRQTDKVAKLSGGIPWYNHLSEHFCHGRGDLRGASWRGGVVSMATVQDELAFAGFMDCLAEQVAVMNAYAASCPMPGDDGRAWIEATVAQLREMRKESKAVRDPVVSAFSNVDKAQGR